jgi:hypothetical protein
MVGPGIANTSVANRRGGYTVEAREMRIGDSRCPDVVDFGDIELSEEEMGIETTYLGW